MYSNLLLKHDFGEIAMGFPKFNHRLKFFGFFGFNYHFLAIFNPLQIFPQIPINTIWGFALAKLPSQQSPEKDLNFFIFSPIIEW